MTAQWLHRYRLCIKFAAIYDSEHRYDIVHDAYVYYLSREGEDLFELDLKNESSYLYTIIKRAFHRWYYKERKGERYKYFPPDDLSSKFDDPEETLIGKDLYEIFYKKLFLATKETDNRHYRTERGRRLPMDIFRLKAEGYTQKEIADQLNTSKQLVNQYVKKIEEMAVYNNPFSGSKTICKKKISETAWDKRKDKEDFEYEDENEMVKLYVHKESNEGWLITIKDPKGSEFYIKRLEDGNKKN